MSAVKVGCVAAGVSVMLDNMPVQPEPEIVASVTTVSAPSKASAVPAPVLSLYNATPEEASVVMAAKVVVAKGALRAVPLLSLKEKDAVTAVKVVITVGMIFSLTIAVALEPALIGAPGKLPLIRPTELTVTVAAALAGKGTKNMAGPKDQIMTDITVIQLKEQRSFLKLLEKKVDIFFIQKNPSRDLII